jgi:hypothetical protein
VSGVENQTAVSDVKREASFVSDDTHGVDGRVRCHNRARRAVMWCRQSPIKESMMRVFVAGATGAIGKQLVPRLVAAGHEVHGMTQSASNRAPSWRQGLAAA